MHITLMHNPKAGGQRHGAHMLQRLLTDAGHAVAYHAIGKEGWTAALDDPGDLVVVAGGDGAVRKVAIHLVGRGIPIAVLPLGTANNIARSLGIGGPPAPLIDGLESASRHKLDVGMVHGPSGQTRFLESVGTGLVAHALFVASTEKATEPPRSRTTSAQVARDVRLLSRMLRTMPTSTCTVLADGEDLSGEYVLCEVLNIHSIGPNLMLAPNADLGDGRLDLVLLGEHERARLQAYLADPRERPRALSDLPVRRARHVLLSPGPAKVHIDDGLAPADPDIRTGSTFDIRLERHALEFLIPHAHPADGGGDGAADSHGRRHGGP